MNLIEDAWIPARRASGEARITPWQLTDINDPVLTLASPRPDFNGALQQFLIGLLQTACPPADDEQWSEWLVEPPAPEVLREHFAQYTDTFTLERFMQDFDAFEGKAKPIASLLVDTPGAQAIRQNTDHFIKNGHVQAICPACAATALFTLQTNAPGGGAGHRTSLRGGGPLTTLVTLDPRNSNLPDTLWHNCWLNVLGQDRIERLIQNPACNTPGDIFPWLSHTRTSEDRTGVETTPLDAHPLQMYWGMPRRIRIDWKNVQTGHCDLCGTTTDRLVQHYVTKNYGINYTGAWHHPLSPHHRNKDGEFLPQHPQPGGLSYRHWLNMAIGSPGHEPAQVVKHFSSLKLPSEQLRLHSFGYDMDKMKARCWYESTFPLYLVDPSVTDIFAQRVESLIATASDAAGLVRTAIKEAWFKRPGDAKGDITYLVEAFFSHTETSFFNILQALLADLRADGNGIIQMQAWHPTLLDSALTLFDHWTSQGDSSVDNLRRITVARNKLARLLNGKKFKGRLHIGTDKEKAA